MKQARRLPYGTMAEKRIKARLLHMRMHAYSKIGVFFLSFFCSILKSVIYIGVFFLRVWIPALLFLYILLTYLGQNQHRIALVRVPSYSTIAIHTPHNGIRQTATTATLYHMWLSLVT